MPLPLCFGKRSRLAIRARFLRDVALALPAIIGWYTTRNPMYRARVKSRLRLTTQLQTGPLAANLFITPNDTIPDTEPVSITIVLPVYNAFDLLAECLNRVERHTDLPYRLILIEDGSTDDRVRPFLRDWAMSRPMVRLLENDGNKGFIASVNRGLAVALDEANQDDGPIVLLNSDAFVPENWASRLIRPFQTHSDVASVTPMSNDAEIMSVPVICQRTPLIAGQGDKIDAMAQEFHPEALLSVAPTGVGFCMAMGRDWLAKAPSFDTAFGRGYGEEVDWCQKVIAQGGQHLALSGLFVEHRGGESFGSEDKLALVARNNAVISKRYPDYDREVQDFIAADPLLTARLALGLAWAGSLEAKTPVPVYLAHSLGGGADHYLEHRMANDLENGRPSVVLRVGGPHRWSLELVTAAGRHQGVTEDFDTVKRLLDILPAKHVVYSCGVGDTDPLSLPKHLLDLMSPTDSAEMLFHDYLPLSPSYTLLDRDGVYRGPVVPPRHDEAHSFRAHDGQVTDLNTWQDAWLDFAMQAQIVTFSQNSAKQVAAVWPDLAASIDVVPHTLPHGLERLPTPDPNAPMVIGILGNIGQQKGAGVVRDMAKRLFDNHGREAKLILVGNIDPTFALPEHVTVHGSYAVRDLPTITKRYRITHWVIPSIWPETFCYTVHEALATGLPVFAFDIGAQGDAVRDAANGYQIPFDPDADLAHEVAQSLKNVRKGR
ncbi:glycosyltransferase [Roseovarius sp. MMSF_3281]|uniref:glycosyltransferase n=1 Tax=Roseovarius sp. MMSF_3281 TaxID=3046694 RepID=UPI00273E9B16|nr:glycosyltransferase [Roseovarius sp. MMSF_3281]